MKLSKLIYRQIPEFIRENHPDFVKFIQAYYEFVEEQSFIEKDTSTSSGFQVILDAISNEVAYSLPKTLVEQQFFLQRVKDVYQAKGSEESFRFLFRALFDTEIDFYYPKEQILKPSDGEWIQKTSIFVRVIIGKTDKRKQYHAQVISANKNTIPIEVVESIPKSTVSYFDMGYVRTAIQSVINLGYTTNTVEQILEMMEDSESGTTIVELSINKRLYDDLKINDVFIHKDANSDLVIGYIIGTTSSVDIVRGGSGFNVGDIIKLNNSSDNENTSMVVTKVGLNGVIQDLEFLNIGHGYANPFLISASSTGDIRLIYTYSDVNSLLNIGFEESTRFIEESFNFYKNFDYSLDSTGILNVVLSNPVRAYSTNYYAHIVDSTGNNAKLKILLNETPKLLPGKNKYNLSGYINTTKDSNVVIGDQTSFLSELRIGDILRSNVDNIVGVVFKIESDTSLILESACAYSLRRRLAHVVERTIVGFDIDMPGSGYSEDAYLKLVDVDASKFDRVYSQSQNPYFLTDYTKYIDEEDMCFVGDYNESSYFSQSYSIHYPIPNADLIVDKCQYNELGTLAHSITTYDYIPRKSDPFSKENAIIKFNVGPVAKYPGHYQNTTGMLSNYSVLYDGKYYQDYSYVIRSNIRQDRYAPYIRKTIHPSGFAMFSERLLESNLSALDPLYGKMWGDYCVDEYTRSERVCVSDFVKVNE